LQAGDVERLRAMGPAHLRVNIDLTGAEWRDRLAFAAAEAGALGAALEVELQTGAEGQGAAEFFRAAKDVGVPLARVLAFPAGKLVTTAAVMNAVLAARDAAGVPTPVGGGSRAFFSEWNRAAADLPLGKMELAGFPVNPTVHAIDNASLAETLAAQPATVASARAIVGAMPIAVGPVTFRMPFNPNATGPAPEPAPGTLPATVDERQPSLFGAAWTAGSIGRLAGAGAASLTFFQTNGWRGVMERSDHPLRVPGFHSWPGMTFPLYHVLADAMEFAGGELLALSTSDGLALDGFAVRTDGRTRVVLANLTDGPVAVGAELPAGTARLRALDERSFRQAGSDPAGFRAAWSDAPGGGAQALTIGPCGVVTIDIG
ncbi:MAG: hypothetical protein ACKOWF_18780, partial [Chloroflexota bacterium]